VASAIAEKDDDCGWNQSTFHTAAAAAAVAVAAVVVVVAVAAAAAAVVAADAEDAAAAFGVCGGGAETKTLKMDDIPRLAGILAGMIDGLLLHCKGIRQRC